MAPTLSLRHALLFFSRGLREGKWNGSALVPLCSLLVLDLLKFIFMRGESLSFYCNHLEKTVTKILDIFCLRSLYTILTILLHF